MEHGGLELDETSEHFRVPFQDRIFAPGAAPKLVQFCRSRLQTPHRPIRPTSAPFGLLTIVRTVDSQAIWPVSDISRLFGPDTVWVSTHIEQNEPASGPSLLIRYVPVGLVLIMLGGVTHQALKPLTDPDIWWHLRMGDELRDGWNFSQTQGWTPFATAPWVRTQWLPEVVQSWMNSAFGLPGVAWLFGVSLMVIVAALYLVCRRQAGTLAAAVATAVGFLGMSASLSPRPQLVSFVLVLVCVDAWLQTAQDLRPRWWLIALSWIWACSHGMWLVGPVIGLTVTVGLVMDRRLRRGQAVQLFLVSVLGFVAAGLTPVGPQLLRTPFAVGNISGFITEWAAPSIRDIAPAVTFAVFAIVVLMWTRGKRVPWTHVGLLLLAMGWALLSARTVTLGAAIVAPLFADSLQDLLAGARGRLEAGSRISGSRRIGLRNRPRTGGRVNVKRSGFSAAETRRTARQPPTANRDLEHLRRWWVAALAPSFVGARCRRPDGGLPGVVPSQLWTCRGCGQRLAGIREIHRSTMGTARGRVATCHGPHREARVDIRRQRRRLCPARRSLTTTSGSTRSVMHRPDYQISTLGSERQPNRSTAPGSGSRCRSAAAASRCRREPGPCPDP